MRKRAIAWVALAVAIAAAGFVVGRGTINPISGPAAAPVHYGSPVGGGLGATADTANPVTDGGTTSAPASHPATGKKKDKSDDGRKNGPARPGGSRPSGKTRHLALNTDSGDWAKLASLGYNVFDVGPDAGELESLPAGGKGMLWAGNTTCGDFDLSFGEFTAAVRRLAHNPRVYGWYLSDEPDPKECPEVVGEIRRRADYINAHAPDQKAFISATDYEYRPLRPANTHVDLIGLDPYPCRSDQSGRCDMRTVDHFMNGALAGGFPRDAIVPVFQTFGQECTSGEQVNLVPTATELRQLLSRWKKFAPSPALDISYSWGHQEEWACPTLQDKPGLQAVMKQHNR